MMQRRYTGIVAALGAAVLFGVGTPFAKLLLGETNPWLLAGLLYSGSGLGLFLLRAVRRDRLPRLRRNENGWLVGSVISGGLLAPVLLMWGLSGIPASEASLLLNAEVVLTALLAWFVFRENFDRRIAGAMGLIVFGGVLLAWPGEDGSGAALPALAVIAACLFWALDNNMTRKISLADATFVAMVKGLAAGAVNLSFALIAGAHLPQWPTVAASALLGFVSYGLSLAMFVIALRHLGTARTGAYFAIAPFAGAVVAVLFLHEPITAKLIASGLFMGIGIWIHLTERHVHEHSHGIFEHEHAHEHDEHHRHAHHSTTPAGTPHSHWHRHEPLTHTHPHYPDAHHRHDH
jgi:drug/metabolite transporter (DMT)-like permease